MKISLNHLILAIGIISIISCAKSATLNEDSYIQGPTDSSFQPSSAGSFWVYNDWDKSGKLIDSIHVNSTGRDTSINNNNYVIFNYDTSQQFQYHNGNQYAFRFTSYNFNTPSGIITVKGLNVFYINNSNDVVGTTWNFSCVDGDYVSTPVVPAPVQTRAIGTVRSTGGQLTDSVNNITYKNVFYSHIKFQANYFNVWNTIGSMEIYTAKKVGVVLIKTYNQSGQLTNTQTLKRYNIN